MSVLADLQLALTPLSIPMETGVFTEAAPSQYIVVVPLTDTFELFADNFPGTEVQEARLSLFSKGNYMPAKKAIVSALLASDFTITDRRYNGFDAETGYHYYVVDVAKHYEMEE